MPKRPRSSVSAHGAYMQSLKRRRTSAKATAHKAMTIAKQTRKFVNKTIENKQVSFQQLSIDVASGVGGYSSNIAAGVPPVLPVINPEIKIGSEDGALTTNSSSRIGNSITLMRSGIDFTFDVAVSTEPYNKFRLIVVESTEGAEILALSDILLFPTQPMSSVYTTKSLTNKRYKILMDKKFTVSSGYTGAKFIKFRKRYGKTGRVINYDGINVAPTDYKLTVLCVSDSTVAPHPKMEYTMRHHYKDA